jgi:hypothetical protein
LTASGASPRTPQRHSLTPAGKFEDAVRHGILPSPTTHDEYRQAEDGFSDLSLSVDSKDRADIGQLRALLQDAMSTIAAQRAEIDRLQTLLDTYADGLPST